MRNLIAGTAADVVNERPLPFDVTTRQGHFYG